jgi:hypothetical protein
MLSDPRLVHIKGLNISKSLLECSGVLPVGILSVHFSLGVAGDISGQRFEKEASNQIGLILFVKRDRGLESGVSNAVDFLVHLVGELGLDLFDVIELLLVDLVFILKRLHLLCHPGVLVLLPLVAGSQLK